MVTLLCYREGVINVWRVFDVAFEDLPKLQHFVRRKI